MSCEGCPSKGNCSKDVSSCQLQPNPNSHIRYMVAVMSGKGGVGKSTVTVSLARAMARMGLKVGILDADITGPSIPRLMSLEDEKAYANEKQEILPIVSMDGVEIMSLNYLLADEKDPVVWRGPVVSNVLRQFYSDVCWGDLDVLLIDMPPGTGDVALTILQEFPVNGVVMVSTPQPMVSMIVTKAIRMCEKMHIRVLGIIENMAYLNCPHCDERIDFYNMDELNAFIQESSAPLLQTLPMMDLLREINTYDSKTLKEQETIQTLFEKAAKELMTELEQK